MSERMRQFIKVCLCGLLSGVAITIAKDGHPYVSVLCAQVAGFSLAMVLSSAERRVEHRIMSVVGSVYRSGAEISQLAGIGNLGTIYASLQRLSESGLIESCWDSPDRVDRRRYYRRPNR